jgi:adenylate cyclase
VLEGSVRRSDDRVRITAQLIDATSGTHRWAERYDRKLKDVFAVQDEVARTIVAILAAHISKAERAFLVPTASMKAHDYYLRATALVNSFLATREVKALHEARALLEQCISGDANYARAYALLSFAYLLLAINPVDENFLKDAVYASANEHAQKAIQLDPNLPRLMPISEL